MSSQPVPRGGAWVVALVLVAVGLSSLLQAAHFLRYGALPLVLASVGLPFLLFTRRAWAVRVVQAALGLGALSWLWTAHSLMSVRQLLGTPYLRMLVILGAVALFTAIAALALEAGPLRRALRPPSPCDA